MSKSSVALEQALIAEKLAEHYAKFGDVESAAEAQQVYIQYMEEAFLDITDKNDAGKNEQR